jgi:pSer/pThr/pTyr-binding forkhead associated (FHA) protein
MTAIPHIIVQLVHIEGPLKGEIQELFDAEIIIGRHPDCQVQYPKDMGTLSRKHARILREGNRFKIIDQSTNGTFVNGKPVTEAYLKDGDVINFAEGGPKLSFLTQVSDQPLTQQPAPPPQAALSPAAPSPVPAYQPAPPPPGTTPVPPASSQHVPPPLQQPVAPDLYQAQAAPEIQSVKVPFAIQYGPALKSFQSLPITLGRGTRCDFVINHPALNDQHAQIFFAQDRYWIKDLTGSNAISINAMAIAGQAPLQPDAQLSLSPQGPKFRFLGGGRLAEVEDPLPVSPAPKEPEAEVIPQAKPDPESIGQKAGTLFNKFFS